MTRFAEICEAISRSVAEEGWDQTPRLGLIVEEPPEAGHDIFVVIGMPIAENVWNEAHPADVMKAVTHIIETSPIDEPPLEPGQKVVGVVACIESWQGIVPGHATDQERREFATWCETHSVGDHPWGHEARNTWIVGFDGSFVHTDHVRDYGTHVTVVDDHPGTVATGRLVDALTGLAFAMKEVTTA